MIFTLVPGVTWLKSVLISSSRRRIQPELTRMPMPKSASYREANKRRHRPPDESHDGPLDYPVQPALPQATQFLVPYTARDTCPLASRLGLHACQKRWSPLSVSACHHLTDQYLLDTRLPNFYPAGSDERRSSAMLITMPSRGASGSRVCNGIVNTLPARGT